ncbi:hypothetical protein [Caballeronia sp. HLA56]
MIDEGFAFLQKFARMQDFTLFRASATRLIPVFALVAKRSLLHFRADETLKVTHAYTAFVASVGMRQSSLSLARSFSKVRRALTVNQLSILLECQKELLVIK